MKSGSVPWQPRPSHCSLCCRDQKPHGHPPRMLVCAVQSVLFILLLCPLLLFLESAPVQLQFKCCCCLKSCWIFFFFLSVCGIAHVSLTTLIITSVPLPTGLFPPQWEAPHTCTMLSSSAGWTAYACCPCPRVPCVQHPWVKEAPWRGIEVGCWSDWFSSLSFSSRFRHVP